jgi:hypothetical protein
MCGLAARVRKWRRRSVSLSSQQARSSSRRPRKATTSFSSRSWRPHQTTLSTREPPAPDGFAGGGERSAENLRSDRLSSSQRGTNHRCPRAEDVVQAPRTVLALASQDRRSGRRRCGSRIVNGSYFQRGGMAVSLDLLPLDSDDRGVAVIEVRRGGSCLEVEEAVGVFELAAGTIGLSQTEKSEHIAIALEPVVPYPVGEAAGARAARSSAGICRRIQNVAALGGRSR